MLLLAGITQGRADFLASSLDDRLHQPYRKALCPLLPALQELSGSKGILGAVLSGAGPSVLVFLDSKKNATKTQKRVADHLRASGLSAELILTSIRARGARAS